MVIKVGRPYEYANYVLDIRAFYFGMQMKIFIRSLLVCNYVKNLVPVAIVQICRLKFIRLGAMLQ